MKEDGYGLWIRSAIHPSALQKIRLLCACFAVRAISGAPKMDLPGLRALLRLATEATLLLGRMATNKLGMCKKSKDRLDTSPS